MIVVTGAAGFIGSNLVSKLNAEGHKDLLLVDDFSKEEKNKNLEGKEYQLLVERDIFIQQPEKWTEDTEFIFHLGARTDTTEFDVSVFDKLNLGYSKSIMQVCGKNNIPLLYASSAATYGMGEHGYKDSHDMISKLVPLNPYGESKNNFDKWVLQHTELPDFWAGIKFFNVYGPNEYHKGRMASVIFHAYNQIKATGAMKLFRSHNPDYKDGEQQRDFIYVKDVIDVLYFFMRHRKNNGIYNLGTGKARTFLDLTLGTFDAMNLKPIISFKDTPKDIRDKYQYYTQADMHKLRAIGYKKPFTSLEAGIDDYVKNYLSSKNFH